MTIYEVAQEVVQQTFFERNGERLLASFITSVLFLFALSRLKPNIKICDKISQEMLDGELHYGFKVINKSWFFKVYDIRARVYALKIIPSENNEDYHLDDITLRKDDTWYLNRLNVRHCFQDFTFKRKRLKKRTDYAVQFFTKEELKNLVGTDKRIRFEILAKHSLSGFSVVKNYTFRHKNDLVKGSFLSGNTALINE